MTMAAQVCRPEFSFFADHLSNPSLHLIIAYMMRKTDAKRLPRRSDIDPAEIPALLPHIMLIDVLGSRERFRFRLVGTHITRAIGEDNTGRDFQDLPRGTFLPWLPAICERCVTERQLQEVWGDLHWAGQRQTLVEAFYMPMSSDGETVDMNCGGVDLRRVEG
jgi:hypothetical protein